MSLPVLPAPGCRQDCLALQGEMRTEVDRSLGVERAASELREAVAHFERLERQLPASQVGHVAGEPGELRIWLETRNMLLIARLMAKAALEREESRGAHFRRDFPLTRESWARQVELSLSDLDEPASEERLYAAG